MWEQGPAWKAGIRPGDLITHVNGQNVAREQEIIDQQMASKVGTQVLVKVKRQGQIFDTGLYPKTIEAAYAAMAEFYDTEAHQKVEYKEPIGLPDARPFWGITVNDNGDEMIVEKMWQDGPAWKG